jgi:hypothetical protein
MNNKFDELTKQMAQSVTRRRALKKFGLGLAGMALACFGLANKAQAGKSYGYCQVHDSGSWDHSGFLTYTGGCVNPATCSGAASADCPPPGTLVKSNKLSPCGGPLSANGFDEKARCSFTL